MRYRLNIAHKNKNLIEAHVNFFRTIGENPYGVFEEWTEPTNTDKNLYITLKVKNYSNPFGAFSKNMFIPAEPETKLEDWL